MMITAEAQLLFESVCIAEGCTQAHIQKAFKQSDIERDSNYAQNQSLCQKIYHSSLFPYTRKS